MFPEMSIAIFVEPSFAQEDFGVFQRCAYRTRSRLLVETGPPALPGRQ